MSVKPVREIVAIVVTWNGGDEAVAALRSLAGQDAGAGPGGQPRALRVVAVDNASSDNTVAQIRAELPEVSVLELPENIGYGPALNRAMAHFPADAYTVCNQDAEYQPGFVAALADALEQARAGAATAQVRLRGRFVRVDDAARSNSRKYAPRTTPEGIYPPNSCEFGPSTASAPRILVAHDGTRWREARADEAGEALLNSTGNQVTKSGNGLDRGWLQPVGTDFPVSVFGFHGGAAMLRAEAVEPLGGFDEGYFMYYEDTDLSWRLRRAGWRIVYASDAVSVHAHAGSSGTESAQFLAWNRCNRLRCALRNGPVSMKVRALVRTLGADAKRAVLALRSGRETTRHVAGESALRQTEGAARAQGAARAGHIVLDFTSLPPQLGGVGRYLEGLAVGFAAIDPEGTEILRSYLVKPDHIEHFRLLDPAGQVHPAPAWIAKRGLRFVWEQTHLVRTARRLGGSVLLSPHYTFPLAAPGLRRVVTVHDATFFSDPQAHSPLKRRFFSAWIRRGVRAHVRLIAPSQATADEVTKYAGTPWQPITVAHHGVDHSVFHPPTNAELAAFRAEHGVERWLAFLGTIEPRKRVGELIRAHRQLPDAPPLLISGQRGWDADAIAELERADGQVRELGYLPLEQLRALLGGAEVFVYASIAEGFGLPVLEAMASGAPVLTTRLSALPEVGGDAVAYCEPNAESIAAGLGVLLQDVPGRDALRLAGQRRAASFTWERCARIHLDAFGVCWARFGVCCVHAAVC